MAMMSRKSAEAPALMAPPISQRLQKVPSKVTVPAAIPGIMATAVERPSANKNPTRFSGSLEVHSAPNVGE
jgi:hypothetical protein